MVAIPSLSINLLPSSELYPDPLADTSKKQTNGDQFARLLHSLCTAKQIVCSSLSQTENATHDIKRYS